MFAFDKLMENKVLMFSAGAVVLLAAALLILFIIRLLFGRRLHMPGGGRARQPRLGIVDAFDLDRQRQLVLVRRDNVEHLVMIGGPNDVLIESQIIRADARPREKETTVSPVTAAPLPWPGNAGNAEPKLVPEDMPVAARDDLRTPAPPLSSLPPEPAFAPTGLAPRPVPPAPIAAPVAPGLDLPPLSAPPLTVAPAGPQPTPPAKRPPFMPPRRPLATPTFGPKPAVPPAPGPGPSPAPEVQSDDTIAVPETAELSHKLPSAAPLPVAPIPAASSPAGPMPASPPPRQMPGQPPSFLRQRTAFGGQVPGSLSPGAVPPPKPGPVLPPQGPVEPTIVQPAPAVGVPVQPKPPQPPVSAAPEKEPVPEPPKQDALDTLEEEMAKLLGRNLDKP